MADAILFRPKFLDYSITPFPIPWALLYIGSALVNSGYSVTIIDELAHPCWQDLVLEELKQQPMFAGVTVMTGKQIKYGLAFSDFVKKHSSIPLVWGGVHPSLFPEQTLKNRAVDFIVKGEGETTIFEFMKHLEGQLPLDRVKGMGFKEKGTIYINEDRPLADLDFLPRIHYSLIDLGRYTGRRFGSRRSFELCTSRGCPHHCAFCYNRIQYNGTWRSMSIDFVFENLHELIDRFEIDGLTWREDNFFVSRKRVADIAERLIREKINLKWHADCRIDYVDDYDDHFIQLLKESGCHTLTLGVESGSDTLLKHINKGITRDQVLRVKDKLSRHGIHQNYHFMLGLPEESEEDVYKTVSLIYDLMHKNRYFGEICGPSLYTPYPGTALFEESLRKGFRPPETLEGWIDMDWHSLRTPWITGGRKRVIEDIAWNAMGMSQKFVAPYFKYKFYLLAKFHLHIPCFEKKIYPRLKKFQDSMAGITRGR
jgi:anaerobic magnesium-protoporphyrin IX monomethyl ester cyclase